MSLGPNPRTARLAPRIVASVLAVSTLAACHARPKTGATPTLAQSGTACGSPAAVAVLRGTPKRLSHARTPGNLVIRVAPAESGLARPVGSEPVPPLLEKLRLEMLSKQPERRPASAAVVKQRIEDALDPRSLATQLVTRKGNEPLGDRESRAPEWEGKNARASHPTDPGHGLTEVGWIRLAATPGIDPSCITGLASQGIYLVPLEALDDKARQALGVVVVDGRVVVHRQIGRLDQMARRRELLLTDPGWRHAVDRQPTVEQRRVAREAERRERALERFWKEAGEL